MLMVSLLNWWYTRGWKDFLQRTGQRLANLVDFFSIDLLIKTLFAPFRQISAGSSKTAPLDVKLRMFFDRLVSRIIGAAVRTVILIAGIICIGFAVVMSLVVIILWPLMPVLPVAGIVLTVMGVTW